MATKEEILDSIGALTVLELKELLDAFEEKFGVTAAAPVAVAAAAPAGGGAAPEVEEKDEFDVILDRRRRPEDPGHQGCPRADQPRPQGGQGPRRRRPQGRPRKANKEAADAAKTSWKTPAPASRSK